MAGRELTFIFYLVDTPTGLCYYRDSAGNVQKLPVQEAIDLNLRNAPDGWMNVQLGFSRNQHYFGLNRSFSLPQKLVNNAAFIVRYLTKRGRGIEVPLTMIVYKYDGNPGPDDPTYELYYKGQVDLPKARNIVAEGVQANLMEGGFMQLLKAYEGTFYEIPCDGSLYQTFPDGTVAQNIKVDMDGMLFEDTFNIQVAPIKASFPGDAPVPTVFISNEGDNAGIIHNDQQYEQPTGSYYQTSNNYLYSSELPIKVHVTGEITVAPSDSNNPCFFKMFFATSESQTIGVDSISHGTNLVPQVPTAYPNSIGVPAQIRVTEQTVFKFDVWVNLDAQEKLFLMFFNQFEAHPIQLVSGSMQMTFASQFPATSVWGLTLYDLGRVLIQNICADASINGQTFNYQLASQLLQDNLNLVATSGDALRASGDPNYQRFYNAVQNNPNFPNVNNYYSYGPVIKTCLADYFDSVNALLNASMSVQQLPGQKETIFIERKGYVFDQTIKNLDNGEVSEFSEEPALDLYFTLLKIGYPPQQYDQKAGKYAWNTTAEWVSPIKSIPSKTLEITCKYLTDPYLIERLRSNVDNTSSTRNGSDNTVFVINTDPESGVPDTYEASFTSPVPLPTNPSGTGNTNIILQTRQYLQGISMPTVAGSYMSFSRDTAIFLFNQPALSAAFNVHVNITGNLLGNPFNALTGQPADMATIRMWINGAVFQTWTTTALGASTPINNTFAGSHNFSFKDCIYFTIDTSVTATVSLNASLVIDNGSPYLSASGSAITINPGVVRQLIALPNATAINDSNTRPVISFGFQYFVFNSILINNDFDYTIGINGLLQGTVGSNASFDLFVNGVSTCSQSITRNSSAIQPFSVPLGANSFNRNFQVGDIVFLVGSAQNDVKVYITGDINHQDTTPGAALVLTSTQIFARLLKRVQYDSISGIPTLLGNLPGTTIPITTGAGAPYNIEDLTPKRLLMKHGNYIRSILFDQIPGQLSFSTLSKNQYLVTTYQGKTIAENVAVQVSDFDNPLFKAVYLNYKTRVQETFAKIMSGATNAYVAATYYGVPIPGFPMEMKQKPALNEMQEWKLLAAPDLDLTTLIDLNVDGIKYLDMKPNSIFCSFLSPIQFVPEGQVLPTKYHTRNRNLFWFNEQIVGWINQNNYWNPWQKEDNPTLQFITRDLSQVVVKLYNCQGTEIASTSATLKSSPSVIPPYFLWEVPTDFTSLAEAGYYMRAIGGAGANTATLISEGLNIKADWPDTLMLEYSSSQNKQSMIFDTGFTGQFRLRGFFDNSFKQKYKGAFYIDQPQDIQILNAIPYEVADLWCGLEDGIPDYVFKKAARILLLDGAMIEGEGFSLDEGAEWEETFIEGNPKKYQKIAIRPSRNLDGIYASVDGFEEDTTMMVSLDAQFFGPNAGNAGSAEPDIITVTIS